MEDVDALSPGAHAVVLGRTRQRNHVSGTGPVCIVHSGGPGIEWEALGMPAIEVDLRTIYVEPIAEYAAEHRSRAPADRRPEIGDGHEPTRDRG